MSSFGDQCKLHSLLTSLVGHTQGKSPEEHVAALRLNSQHVSRSVCTILIIIFLFDQAATQACTHRAPKEPSSTRWE